MTVKTQGGKVITKGGKVSCECCEEGCFIYELYPAANYEAGYNFEDLPDEVLTLDFITGLGNVTLYKESGSVEDFNYVYSGFYKGSGSFAIGIVNIFSPGWIVVLYSTDEEGNKTIQDSTNQSAYLQYLDSTAGRNIIFANSYIVNTPSSASITVLRPVESDPVFPDGTLVPTCDFWCEKEFGPRPINPPNPCAIFRKNPGLWLGSGASLYFDYVQSWSSEDEFTVVGDSFKWTIKTSAGTFQKIGDQNTPVGSYAGGFTVS
jgi:hypothetical protein